MHSSNLAGALATCFFDIRGEFSVRCNTNSFMLQIVDIENESGFVEIDQPRFLSLRKVKIFLSPSEPIRHPA
jgi:hypothetical protein